MAYGLWFSVSLIVGTAAYFLVNNKIPYPYMDEEFHVRQTLVFLKPRSEWAWDPKITTPPGLYIIGWLIGKMSPALNCIRLSNFLVLLVLGYLGDTAAEIVYTFPLFNFYVPLYYTDVWSTFLVLLAFVPNSFQFLPLFASLLFRQTNIVWAGLVGAFNILEDTKFSQIPQNLTKCIMNLKKCWSLAPLVAFAIAFVKYNAGIVLGDKTNHGATIHLAQLLYFLLFFTLFSAPLASKFVVKHKMFNKWLLIPVELTAIVLIVKYGTIVHPFILSDNRHYTFYLWRRFIQLGNGMAMVPIYFICWRWFCSVLQFDLVKTWAYLACCAAVLVPTPLMEPRYYILPYLIWRVWLYKRPMGYLEGAWQTAINVATLVVFSNSKTHFMW